MDPTLTRTLQNCVETVPARNERNDNGTIKQQNLKESMEACQGVSKIISEAVKIPHPAELRPVKPGDDYVAINNSDKRSIDPRPVSCQGSVLPQTAESGIVTNQNEHVAGQGRGSKRKLDDLEDQAIAVGLDLGAGSQQDRSRTNERIKPRVKDTPTTFTSDEKAARSRIRNSRIRNSRMSMEGKPFWKKHVSTPKYASFLRMFCKEETDDRLRGNSSSRRNEGEKSQYQRGLSAERYDPEIRI